jgi:hypothetical protein
MMMLMSEKIEENPVRLQEFRKKRRSYEDD